jgi:beta-phosphoglucomutase-like phosphatase (HAD superfamily)
MDMPVGLDLGATSTIGILGSQPREMVAVEDSFAGATSASAPGMHVFAVTRGGVPLPPAQNALRRLDELPDLILPWPVEVMSEGRTSDGL